MNPASQGNHNQLTAPLLLWCKAAGPWSVLTWLPVMLNDIDWRWVSVVHLIEWLLPAGSLELKMNAGYNKKERQMPAEGCHMTKLCVLLQLQYIHVYWKFSFHGWVTEQAYRTVQSHGPLKCLQEETKKWPLEMSHVSFSLTQLLPGVPISWYVLVLYRKSGKASMCVPRGLLTYNMYVVTLCIIICVPVFFDSFFLAFPIIDLSTLVLQWPQMFSSTTATAWCASDLFSQYCSTLDWAEHLTNLKKYFHKRMWTVNWIEWISISVIHKVRTKKSETWIKRTCSGLSVNCKELVQS